MHKGIAPIIWVIIAVVLLGGGYGAYRKYQPLTTNNQQQEKAEDVDTKNWNTYRNEEIGIEFKYPKEFSADFKRDVYPSTVWETLLLTDSVHSRDFLLFINPPYVEALGIDKTVKIRVEGKNISLESVVDEKGDTTDGDIHYFSNVFENNNNAYALHYILKVGDAQGEDILKNILSTFRFTK